MSGKSTTEKEQHGEATDATIEGVIAVERQRCIDRVLTYAALRDQAAGHWQIDRHLASACAKVSHEANFLCSASISA